MPTRFILSTPLPEPGSQFSLFTVLGPAPTGPTDFPSPPSIANRARVLARCNCGEVVVVSVNSLTTGKRKTCGCSKHARGDLWKARLMRAQARPTVPEVIAHVLSEERSPDNDAA